jgi:hypothetical protein
MVARSFVNVLRPGPGMRAKYLSTVAGEGRFDGRFDMARRRAGVVFFIPSSLSGDQFSMAGPLKGAKSLSLVVSRRSRAAASRHSWAF